MWNALGDALFELGRMAEARSAYQKALRVNSADVQARYNLAWVHTRLKEYPEALARIAEALALDRTGEYGERLLQKQLDISSAVKEALQKARGDYVCLLNNDTVVVPHWLDALVALANVSEDFLDRRAMVEVTANAAPGVPVADGRKLCEALAEAARTDLGLTAAYRLTWLRDIPESKLSIKRLAAASNEKKVKAQGTQLLLFSGAHAARHHVSDVRTQSAARSPRSPIRAATSPARALATPFRSPVYNHVDN